MADPNSQRKGHCRSQGRSEELDAIRARSRDISGQHRVTIGQLRSTLHGTESARRSNRSSNSVILSLAEPTILLECEDPEEKLRRPHTPSPSMCRSVNRCDRLCR
ncbi:hypothetical protein PoB_007147600 [Plakobranchus ocellatus]|uniref:Uncharacterized protein n=1 Tax=Plakobranchus ocellatus TaxID=259542 RepID=A0AAV4DM59_9GAST|nr:hypothetical protein PoB_007147600 [Plakobranchus ocellatus]